MLPLSRACNCYKLHILYETFTEFLCRDCDGVVTKHCDWTNSNVAHCDWFNGCLSVAVPYEQITYECEKSRHTARRGADTAWNFKCCHTQHGIEAVTARCGPCGTLLGISQSSKHRNSAARTRYDTARSFE